MDIMDLIVPAGLVLLSLVLLYIYGTWTYSHFYNCDIPGPRPVPFFGNTLAIWRKGIFQLTRDWHRQYGKTFGFYFMKSPILVTADLDIVKEVFIKDFNNFRNRGSALLVQPPYPLNCSVAFTDDFTWQRLRQTITPTFNPRKLKLMDLHVNRCCSAVSRYLQRLTDKGQLVHVKQVFGAYSLDVIAGTAFGMETDLLNNQNDAILQAALNISGKQSYLNIIQGFLMVFPLLRPVFSFLSMNESSAVNDLARLIEKLIQDRKNNSQSERVDFLQLMLNAEASEAEVAARPQDKHMTKVEIIAQGITVLLGGYDTTATTLQYMVYLLALHPDKQEKLYNEIIAAIGDAAPSYENVMSIKYLDNCVWEALRCFPPSVTVIRVAAETRTIKGVLIPAGICIAALLYVIMQDEENFPEPHRFLPERFDDNSIPTLLRELTFGAGPRQCICMRLALYEIKMVAVTLIRRFRFNKAPETPESISLNKFSWMSFPTKPIFVRAEVRN